ncbi:MAG: hypothetical protein ABUL46_00730, partial [Chitinophaga rupis]
MDNLEDHLKQFWENQTTPSQRREILRQLEESGMEWKDFLQQYYNKVLAGEEAHGLDEARKSKVWQRLRDQHLGQGGTGQGVSGRQEGNTPQGVDVRQGMGLTAGTARVLWYRWMAAASVLLIVGLCIYYWGR